MKQGRFVIWTTRMVIIPLMITLIAMPACTGYVDVDRRDVLELGYDRGEFRIKTRDGSVYVETHIVVVDSTVVIRVGKELRKKETVHGIQTVVRPIPDLPLRLSFEEIVQLDRKDVVVMQTIGFGLVVVALAAFWAFVITPVPY